MHAKRMTDCTYLAQAQMEQLHALSVDSRIYPQVVLVDAGVDSTAPWAYFEHPSLVLSHLHVLLGMVRPQTMHMVLWRTMFHGTLNSWIPVRRGLK